MKIVRILLGLVLLAGVVAVTAQGLKEKPPPPIEVQFGNVKKGPINRTVAGAGKVQATTTVKISSNLSGDLIELSVKEGDVVKVGQTLGKIDKRKFDAAFKQAQSAHNAALSDMKATEVEVSRLNAEISRVTSLVEKGLASKAELENSQSQRDSAAARVAALKDRAAQAAARLDEALNDLSKTTLISPIDGTVIERSREVGERVRGSDFSEDVVMTIAALATMEVQIEVGEHEVVHLKQGQKADVKIDALEGQTFDGQVMEIAQKALIRNPGSESETTNFPIKVGLTARPPGVLPGMSAEVRVLAESRESAVLVPVQAVTVRPEKMLGDLAPSPEGTPLKSSRSTETFAKVVFVVDADKKVHLRRVRTGISSDTNVEIIEGLKEGEQIVEGPYRTLAKELKEGDSVDEAKSGGPGGFKKKG